MGETTIALHNLAKVSNFGSFLVVTYCVIISDDTPTRFAISALVSPQLSISYLSLCLIKSTFVLYIYLNF